MKERLNIYLLGITTGALISFIMFISSPMAKAEEYNLNTVDEDFFVELDVSQEIDHEADNAVLELVDDSMASNDVPERFEDSSIKRKLKDGSVQSFNGNDYMIVPRTSEKPKPKKQVVKERVEIVKTIVKLKPQKKNRVTLYAGYGPADLETNQTVTKIKLDKDAVIGLGYSRKLNESINLDILGLTNETIMGGIGISF